MKTVQKDHLAVVLGLTATGLGVIRSLGREGIPVYGFDYEKKQYHYGFHSKYAITDLCPHPVIEQDKLLSFLKRKFRDRSVRPILFPTADEFVTFISDHREELSQTFQLNLPSRGVVDSIVDKKIQTELVKEAGVSIPDTFCPDMPEELSLLNGQLGYPVIVRARQSFRWREQFGGVIKGFKATNKEELIQSCDTLFERNVPIIIQKVISGPATNHYKYCAYVCSNGQIASTFTLRKLRKHPSEFGIGSSVESVRNEELTELGTALFKAIEYRGVGSAEFKLDPVDGCLKFIELNPRYWLQNELAAFCGANMALVQYLDCSGQEITSSTDFRSSSVWMDAALDFNSFVSQRENRSLTKMFGWVRKLFSSDVHSVFCKNDMNPFLRSTAYGTRLITLLLRAFKRLLLHERFNS